jgi:putative Mg2+ transporter-C (MgtC) family protein
METFVIIFRFLITFMAAFVFGLERQRSHKPVGFGTFTFVATGACVLAITAILWSPQNPLPLMTAIVTGIGFLGAGAMIKTGDKILGATTAAGIWLFAIFGLTIGSGEYFLGGLIYIGMWAVILVDRHLEEEGMGSYQKKLVVITNKIINEKEIRKVLLMETKKYRLVSVDVDKKNNRLSLTYLVDGTKDHLNKIPKRLYEEPWFESCKIE